MELSDVLRVLSVVGSAVAGITTIVAAIFWLVKRYSRKLDKAQAKAKRLEKEIDNALQRKLDAEAARDRALEQREIESAKALRLTERAREYHEAWSRASTIAKKNYAACKSLDEQRRKLEQRADSADTRVGELRASLGVATETIEELRQRLEQFQSRLESVADHGGRVWQVPLRVQPPAFVPLQRRQTRIVSLLNLKGDVGKTTITANLGGYLAKHQQKWVLLIDLDHQRSLTQLLLSTADRHRTAKARRTIQDFLLSARSGSDLRAVSERIPDLERCSIIGNSDAEEGYGTRQNLDDLEMDLLCKWLVNPTGEDVRYLMRGALHSAEVCESSKGFDYVLIDCPPRLTTACINALAASDFVLIPAQAEPISARSVPHLLRRLRELREANVLPQLRALGVVANMVSANVDDPTSKEAKVLRGIEGLALNAWGSPVNLFSAKLRASDRYASAPRKLDEANKLSFAMDAQDIRAQYAKLYGEIEERINENLGVAGVPA